MGKSTCLDSLQWIPSATLYLTDYPFCCNWCNFILFNSWVIILLKIYKHAFLLIKYPCSTRDLGPLHPVSSLFGVWKPTELTFLPRLSRPGWEDALCLREWYKSHAWALLVFPLTREILLSLSLSLSLFLLSNPVHQVLVCINEWPFISSFTSFNFFSLFLIHRLFLVTLSHLLFPSFYDYHSGGPGLL